MSDKITYRDYLIWNTVRCISALGEGLNLAMTMRHDHSAINVLEQRLDTLPELASYKHPDPERVEARPEKLEL